MKRRRAKNALQLYKDLIDALAARRENGYGDWIRQGAFPAFPRNATINALLKQLTARQRKAVAELAQRARDSGMHDVLVEFERMYYDFVCRVAGDAWPDERARSPRARKRRP